MKIKMVCVKCGKEAPKVKRTDGSRIYNISRRCKCGGDWKKVEVYGKFAWE